MFFYALSKNIGNHLTDYIHLWINLFITFTGRFADIKCLIYSCNMSEK